MTDLPAGARRRRRPSAWGSALVFGVAALSAFHLSDAPADGLLSTRAGGRFLGADSGNAFAWPSPNAFGRSGQVRMRFALPNEGVDYPLEVRGDPTTFSYQWVRVADSRAVTPPRSLAGARMTAPQTPGFYRLSLVKDGDQQTVDGPTLAVMVPFSQKLGVTLNGYRIGTYLAERLTARSTDRPDGFVEIGAGEVDLPLTKHLRLSDFISRDGQKTWPRYAALDGRLLDKLELVVAEIARWRGDSSRVQMAIDVRSGFRTPAHNLRVRASAQDSRHQYGDAADVSIDANGDGRINSEDTRLVGLAVEMVERGHPELVGGMGTYLNARTPYVHIDARGARVRWSVGGSRRPARVARAPLKPRRKARG